MSEKIGRFEIVSQLAKSPFATVYKAFDAENQQTVALKVAPLEQVHDRDGWIKRVCDEADTARPLSSHNIAVLYGVGDEDGLLLAATEYVQGNSVATTLNRHDGFSIWDIQDIARQVCQGLDHAHVHKVSHQSLEPAKIMVQWDGMVKVLGFGISSMNALTASSSSGIPEALYYASPEVVKGETCDLRSAIFSLGAVLYEMTAEQKPFSGETAEQIRQAILEQVPPQPVRLKPNVNRGLNDLIMKALAKSPDERYQSGQELVRDLENCKASAAAAKPPVISPAVQPKPRAHAAAAGAGTGYAPAMNAVPATPSAPQSHAGAAPALDEKPSFPVDPMMAADGENVPSKASFSDIAELPPMKEVEISEPAPVPEMADEAIEAPKSKPVYRHVHIDRPKVEVREVAQKAVAEIRKVPPKLVLHAVGAALGLILVLAAGFSIRNYIADREERGNVAVKPAAPVQQPAAQSEASPAAAPVQPAQPSAEAGQEASPAEPEQAQEPAPAAAPSRSRKARARTAVPAVVPAQLTVESTPAGAEITFDGSALCQTPCTLTGIGAGAHTISAAKSGFGSTSRNISLTAGSNATVTLQLEALAPMLSVASTPAGAAIVIDGKDSGKLTPSQFALNGAGAHTVTLRRYGYLEASSTVNVQAGQTVNVNLSLTALGTTDEIHAAGGKFSKVFKKGEASGMAVVSIKTQPKGAQIMVNGRVLDKTSPFDFYLNPGTYVVDVTMSGYRPIHRVITVQEGEKTAIQETLTSE
jgi:eukaryotic-like serine/threonine-protein kinase